MKIEIVFDGFVSSAQISTSRKFKGCQFLLFEVTSINPPLSSTEGVQIGFAINVEVPVIGKTLTRYVPYKITEAFYEGSLDSKEIIGIPREFTDSDYDFYCSFNSGVNLSLRVYSIFSEVNLETINNKLELVIQKQDEANQPEIPLTLLPSIL